MPTFKKSLNSPESQCKALMEELRSSDIISEEKYRMYLNHIKFPDQSAINTVMQHLRIDFAEQPNKKINATVAKFVNFLESPLESPFSPKHVGNIIANYIISEVDTNHLISNNQIQNFNVPTNSLPETPEPSKQELEATAKKCKQLLLLLKKYKLITEAGALDFFNLLNKDISSSIKIMEALKEFYKDILFQDMKHDLAVFLKENDPVLYQFIKDKYICSLQNKHLK